MNVFIQYLSLSLYIYMYEFLRVPAYYMRRQRSEGRPPPRFSHLWSEVFPFENCFTALGLRRLRAEAPALSPCILTKNNQN